MPFPESSPEDLNTGTAETVEQDVTNTADSSSADQGAKSPASMFEAVKAAVNPQAEESPASENQDGTSKSGAKATTDPKKEGDGAEEEDDEGLSDEELQRLNQRTQKRIKKLVAQNHESAGRIADLEPKAQRFEQMANFANEAGLNSEEITAGFNIMRAMKQEPEKALELLRPYVTELLKHTGNILPDDLANEVNQGLITQARAQEIARSRSQKGVTQLRETQAQQTQVQQQNAQRHEEAVGMIVTAVAEVEKRWKTSDPDYTAKSADIADRMKLRVLEGQAPRNPQEAVALVESCKKEVDKKYRRFAAPRTAITSVSGGASPSAAPKPKTLIEAMQQGLAAGQS